MHHATKRVRMVIAVVSVLGFGLVTAQPALAEPDVTAQDVKDALHKAEAANEKVNQLGEEIKSTNADIETLEADIARKQAGYDKQKEALSASIVQQQLNAPLGPTVSLLASGNPAEFIDGLSAIQALNSARADALAQFGKTKKELENRQAQLKDRQSDLVKSKKKADDKRAEVRQHYQQAKTELAQLSEPEQATFTHSNTNVDTGKIKAQMEGNASGRAKTAVSFALAQLGDPYVWGGNGPNAWDCSGLTKAAYAAAGVSIGRVTYSQVKAGRSVSMGALRPGDLVFFSDLSHVGIYIGGGRVVHAPYPGKTVEVTGVGQFSTARRIVG